MAPPFSARSAFHSPAARHQSAWPGHHTSLQHQVTAFDQFSMGQCRQSADRRHCGRQTRSQASHSPSGAGCTELASSPTWVVCPLLLLHAVASLLEAPHHASAGLQASKARAGHLSSSSILPRPGQLPPLPRPGQLVYFARLTGRCRQRPARAQCSGGALPPAVNHMNLPASPGQSCALCQRVPRLRCPEEPDGQGSGQGSGSHRVVQPQ